MTDPLKDIINLFFVLIQFTILICILIFLILVISKINRRIFKHFSHPPNIQHKTHNIQTFL